MSSQRPEMPPSRGMPRESAARWAVRDGILLNLALIDQGPPQAPAGLARVLAPLRAAPRPHRLKPQSRLSTALAGNGPSDAPASAPSEPDGQQRRG
jgi:hypothetical protein